MGGGGEYEAEIVWIHINLNGKTENENLPLVHIVSINYHKLCISAVAVSTPERLNLLCLQNTQSCSLIARPPPVLFFRYEAEEQEKKIRERPGNTYHKNDLR